jgi:glutathione S-transferase
VIKIYGVPVSRAMRCIWMLEELGLPYENVPTHFANGDTHKPDYLKLNPNGHIPTLDDEGTIVWESMAINLHLAMRYGKGLWPVSASDQAHAIQWSFWVMTEFEPGLLLAMMHRAFYPPDQRKPELGDEGEEKLQKPLHVLNDHLTHQQYVLGAAYSVADVNLASVIAWAPYAKIDLAPFPAVSRWLDECTSRPAGKKALGR